MSHAEVAQSELTQSSVVAFLRAMATRAEQDPQLAAAIAAALEQSGFMRLATEGGARPTPASKRRTPGGGQAGGAAAQGDALDPFAVWRASGEEGLREALAGAALAELRAVVRAHRLDPARVSSRWTARERVAALIFDQVKARMRHGRAFERV